MCTGPEYSSMAEPFCLRFVVSKLHRGGELIGSEVFSAAIFFILVLEKMGKNLFVEWMSFNFTIGGSTVVGFLLHIWLQVFKIPIIGGSIAIGVVIVGVEASH